MSKKIIDEIFDKIIAKENIEKAYKKSLSGKGKYKAEAIRFSQNETYNLQRIRQSLIDETYKFDGYINFKVYEPKEREIDAPHYKDKIVQLAINNVLKEIYAPCFMFDNYACLDNKGTHKCVDKIQRSMKKAKWQYGEQAFIVKIDIKKFFYTIDRDVLKKLLPKKIRCKKTLRLLFKIIDSADLINLLGMPLGNTLSQICANIYLNEVDQYAKRRLRLKYVVRYMDDIVIVVPNKQESKEVLRKIDSFVRKRLNIRLNINKSKVFPINRGVNVVGFKIWSTHRLLRNDCKARIKRKIKAMPKLIKDGELTIAKAEQMLNS